MPPSAQAQTTTGTLPHEGLDREYLLHLPAVWDGATPLPLLIGLHGGGGNAASFANSNGFIDLADDDGFIAVLPESVAGS
ncbi:MAG: hypothetical protein AAF589_01630 [Planctomycetota bacterium]